MVLSTSRPVGMGVGAIPVSEIHAWFQMVGRAFDRRLFAKIQVIDGIWLEDHARKEADKNRAGKNTAGKR